jgi:hypothetical protein
MLSTTQYQTGPRAQCSPNIWPPAALTLAQVPVCLHKPTRTAWTGCRALQMSRYSDEPPPMARPRMRNPECGNRIDIGLALKL